MKQIEQFILLEKTERQMHLDLSEQCIERGGNSTVHQGILAQYLDTDIPFQRKLDIHLCHACHNGKCSNPKHLYWGTSKENVHDAMQNGTFTHAWESTVKKYGLKAALEHIRITCFKKGNKYRFQKGHISWNKDAKMKTIKCPYCEKEGSANNMKRWHFDNCNRISL